MSASLRRATSASSASRHEAVAPDGLAELVRGGRQDARLGSVRAPTVPPTRRAQSEPRISPGTSMRMRWTVVPSRGLARRPVGPPATMRPRPLAQARRPASAGARPCNVGTGSGAPAAVSATIVSSAGLGPSPTHRRSIVPGRSELAEDGRARRSARSSVVAKDRLIWNSASASRARSAASAARSVWSADEATDGDRDGQEEQEVEPLARVGDGAA